jgi:lipoate-protein ligase A
VTSDDTLFRSLTGWKLIEEPLAVDPRQALERDTLMAQEVAMGNRGATARLWENPQSLIVTRKETRLPHYQQACDQLAEIGWPVLVRDSGGTAVPHQAGILHLSLVFPRVDGLNSGIEAVYRMLCEPIRWALSGIGLEAIYGSVEGSFCDGRYNLVVDGLKITGTAQRHLSSRSRDTGDSGAILAQAMLMVDADAQAATQVVNHFYALAGDGRQYDPRVSTSVADRLKACKRDIPPNLTTQVRALLRQSCHCLMD